MTDESSRLARGLPAPFPIDKDSKNYKLLDPVGKAIESLDGDISSVDTNSNIQTADSIDALHELAKLMGVSPRTNEPTERFRSRSIAEFQLNTSHGTAEDLITISSVILDVNPTRISYSDADERGVALLGLPGSGLKNLEIEEGEFVDIIQSNVSAGYRVEAFRLGTFEYRTADQYVGGINVDDWGYGGLDEQGEPDETGGTYAGLLN